MTPALALIMSTRGHDSWGVTDGEHIHKVDKDIVESFEPQGYDGPLYHTRGASVGAISVKNAHPFRVESPTKVVIGVHNGHVSNHTDLKEKYKRKDCEVDSEQIFHHLANGEDLAEIGGWGAVVWYEYPPGHPEEKVRYFSRFNHEALFFAKMITGEIVFASTKEAIRAAASFCPTSSVKTFYETEAKRQYWIEFEENGDDRLVVAPGFMNWASNVYTKPVTAYGAGFVHAGGRNRDRIAYTKGICAISDCTTSINDDAIICEYHYGQIAQDLYGEVYA